MGRKYRIVYDREACIGAFACVAAGPNFWEYTDEGKADLKQATFNAETKKWELIIDEKDYDENLAAAEVCPVYAIQIEEIADVPDERRLTE